MRTLTPTPAPRTAIVRHINGKEVMILCPYSPPGKRHRHTHTVSEHGPQRFAPGCGIHLNPEQRAAGYTFETTSRRNNRNKEKNDE